MDDELLFKKIKKSNEVAFEKLFRKYYDSLLKFTWGYVESEVIAEEIVQELFTKIWDKRSSLVISSSVKSYLFSAARNMSLDYLKHQEVVQNWEKEKKATYSDTTHKSKINETLHNKLILKEIEEAIKALPHRRRLIFILSRYQDMTYKEIAIFLDISVHTVDKQIRRALNTLREKFSHIMFCIFGIIGLLA